MTVYNLDVVLSRFGNLFPISQQEELSSHPMNHEAWSASPSCEPALGNSFIEAQRHFQRRRWHPTPVLLPGKSHGWRSLEGCSPWCREESDMTERLLFHFSFSCIGEGNGNPLQCSYLENPRDGGAWWAAISGVAQSWTWLKRLSSSSSISVIIT